MDLSNLCLLHGDELTLINGLKVKHPILSDIVKLDKKDSVYTYNDYVQALTSTKLDVADILWCEMEIWYEDIKKEWDFFLQKCILNKKIVDVFIEAQIGDEIINIKQQAVAIDDLYRDSLNYFLNLNGEYVLLDINSDNKDEKQIVLCNIQMNQLGQYIIDDKNIKFTENFYNEILIYLKKISWKQDEYLFLKGGSKYAKKYILKEQYKKRNKKKEEKYYVTLDSIISSEIAKGVRYEDIWSYPIYVVYDLYYRNIKINEWQNTMDALHSGCIDTDKNPIDWEKINWGSIINLE